VRQQQLEELEDRVRVMGERRRALKALSTAKELTFKAFGMSDWRGSKASFQAWERLVVVERRLRDRKAGRKPQEGSPRVE
jgi:hypothetical protein